MPMEHEELTFKIIGCAMQVHRTLGNRFHEVIYQRALAIEMQFPIPEFEREKSMNIYFRHFDIDTRSVDFIVENSIMVEITATSQLDDIQLNQAGNYLEAYNVKVGLLINLGANSLQFKRVHNNKINFSINQENHGTDKNRN